MSKTWFITGASSGLGPLMAERLLARGDRIVATVRRERALGDLQQQHGDRLAVAMLDLTHNAGIRAVVDDALAHMGRIDLVVSNAGYGLFGAAEELTTAKSITRSRPISPVPSSLSGQHCRACGDGVRGQSCRSPPRAGRSHTRASASTTRPNGVSKASSSR